MINKEKLPPLLAQPEIMMALRQVLQIACPEPLEYSKGKSEADWIHQSGIRAGYLLAYKHLGVEID